MTPHRLSPGRILMGVLLDEDVIGVTLTWRTALSASRWLIYAASVALDAVRDERVPMTKTSAAAMLANGSS